MAEKLKESLIYNIANNQVALYVILEMSREAEVMLRFALKGYRTLLGSKHESTLRALSNLTICMRNRTSLQKLKPGLTSRTDRFEWTSRARSHCHLSHILSNSANDSHAHFPISRHSTITSLEPIQSRATASRRHPQNTVERVVDLARFTCCESSDTSQAVHHPSAKFWCKMPCR